MCYQTKVVKGFLSTHLLNGCRDCLGIQVVYPTQTTKGRTKTIINGNLHLNICVVLGATSFFTKSVTKGVRKTNIHEFGCEDKGNEWVLNWEVLTPNPKPPKPLCDRSITNVGSVQWVSQRNSLSLTHSLGIKPLQSMPQGLTPLPHFSHEGANFYEVRGKGWPCTAWTPKLEWATAHLNN